MNTDTLTAARLDSSVRWIEDGMEVGYTASRIYGVTDGEGNWLTFGDSKSPANFGRKSTAVEVAETLIIDQRLRWVSTFKARA